MKTNNINHYGLVLVNYLEIKESKKYMDKSRIKKDLSKVLRVDYYA